MAQSLKSLREVISANLEEPAMSYVSSFDGRKTIYLDNTFVISA